MHPDFGLSLRRSLQRPARLIVCGGALMLTRDQVCGLLDGTTDKSGPAQKPLSFPKSAAIRAALDHLIVDLNLGIARRGELFGLTPVQDLMLAHRIITWLVATRRATIEGIADARRHVDAIVGATALDPLWMHRQGLASALKTYQKHQAYAQRAIERAGPPREVWRSDEFTMVELLSREHLVVEGARAQNCIGGLRDGFTGLNVPKLRYLRRIESGDYRLFMLRVNDAPVATIEYNPGQGYVSEYSGTPTTRLTDEDVVPLLIGVFAELKLRLRYISLFHEYRLPANAASEQAPPSSSRVRHRLITCPDISYADLRTILATRSIYADISVLPPHRLKEFPADIACHLYSRGLDWPTNVARVAGSVIFTKLKDADFSALEFCGSSVNMPRVRDCCLPRLREVQGHLIMPNVVPERFPHLSVVQGPVSGLIQNRWRGHALRVGRGQGRALS